MPTCVDGIVHAIYTQDTLDGFFIAPDPLPSSESDVEGNEKSSTTVTADFIPPNVTFKCSYCDWHSSTIEEWKQFVNSEEDFCQNSPETLSEYLRWKSENFTPSMISGRSGCATLGRIHPLHYLVFWLEENLTTLSLEELMESCDLTIQNTEEIHQRLHSLQGTLSLLQEMITRLNSFSCDVMPTNLHEKVIYWDRIGQTAIALADHLAQCIALPRLKQQFLPEVLQQYEVDRLMTLQTASIAFREAYHLSALSSGEESKGTKELKILAGLMCHPLSILIPIDPFVGLVEGIPMPSTLHELQVHYSHHME
jgi:hypothetical protein